MVNPSPTLRPLLEAAVERLLAILDAMDGDPDLEPCCEDEGAQCDDEGDRDSDLPAADHPTGDQRLVAMDCRPGWAFHVDARQTAQTPWPS